MKTTPTVINGKVGIADERYPYPDREDISWIKGITGGHSGGYSFDKERFDKALATCLSHMTFFADEEQQIVMRIISFHLWQEVAGHTIPDGPYTVEDLPPYEKVKQACNLRNDGEWFDLSERERELPEREEYDYQLILRFTKQETKPKTPYDTFMEKVNKENGIEQETKPQPM